MKLLLFPVILASLLAALTSAPLSEEDGPWTESYADSAEVEAIYGTAEDEITPEQARQLLTALVNDARRAADLGDVRWSGTAFTLADRHAEEMAQKRYVNHYDLAGRKCELRYNDLGHTDHVAENVSYYEIRYPVRLTPQLVRRVHSHWMKSRTHRQNVLDPAHTHVGCSIVIARSGKASYVSAVEEFVNEYGTMEPLPAVAKVGEVVKVHGRLTPSRAVFSHVGLGSEDLPVERTVEYQLAHIGGYSPPDPVVALVTAGREGATGLAPHVRGGVAYNAVTGEYSVEMLIQPHWPRAAYYFTIFATADGIEGPFPAATQVVLIQ